MGLFSGIGKIFGGVLGAVKSVVGGLGKVVKGALDVAIDNPIKTVAIGVGITALAGMEDAFKQVAMQAQQEQAAGGGIMDENVIVGAGGIP